MLPEASKKICFTIGPKSKERKLPNIYGINHLLRTQNFPEKVTFLTCAYQVVKNVSFSEKFAYVLNE